MVVRNVIMVSECDVMNDTEIKRSHFLCFFVLSHNVFTPSLKPLSVSLGFYFIY